MKLPRTFLSKAIAHRGLHDQSNQRTENSIASFKAAIAHGYGIELDLQMSSDGVAMVFHDYDLARLTGQKGPIAMRTAAELNDIPLLYDGGTIPTLTQVLDVVGGQVPLLIELKDQDGAMGPNVGRLERSTAKALQDYAGDAALMSFNPNSVGVFQDMGIQRPLGIVTAAYDDEGWPTLPPARRDALREIPDFERVSASFISHEAADLGRPRVAELKAQGHNILCWTIKSKVEEEAARKVVDNVTFEGYLA